MLQSTPTAFMRKDNLPGYVINITFRVAKLSEVYELIAELDELSWSDQARDLSEVLRLHEMKYTRDQRPLEEKAMRYRR